MHSCRGKKNIELRFLSSSFLCCQFLQTIQASGEEEDHGLANPIQGF
jgi:hypothetical protein